MPLITALLSNFQGKERKMNICEKNNEVRSSGRTIASETSVASSADTPIASCLSNGDDQSNSNLLKIYDNRVEDLSSSKDKKRTLITSSTITPNDVVSDISSSSLPPEKHLSYVQSLEQEIASVKLAFATLQTKHDHTVQEKNILRNKAMDLTSKISELQTQRNDFEREKDELRKQKEMFTKQQREQQERISMDRSTSNNNSSSSNDVPSIALSNNSVNGSDESDTVKILSSHMSKLTTQNSNLLKQRAALRNDVAQLRKQLLCITNLKTHLEARLEQAQTQHDYLKVKCRNAQESTGKLRGENAELLGAVWEMRVELERLQQELRRKNEEDCVDRKIEKNVASERTEHEKSTQVLNEDDISQSQQKHSHGLKMDLNSVATEKAGSARNLVKECNSLKSMSITEEYARIEYADGYKPGTLDGAAMYSGEHNDHQQYSLAIKKLKPESDVGFVSTSPAALPRPALKCDSSLTTSIVQEQDDKLSHSSLKETKEEIEERLRRKAAADTLINWSLETFGRKMSGLDYFIDVEDDKYTDRKNWSQDYTTSMRSSRKIITSHKQRNRMSTHNSDRHELLLRPRPTLNEAATSNNFSDTSHRTGSKGRASWLGRFVGGGQEVEENKPEPFRRGTGTFFRKISDMTMFTTELIDDSDEGVPGLKTSDQFLDNHRPVEQ